jgi:hypothetical protein
MPFPVYDDVNAVSIVNLKSTGICEVVLGLLDLSLNATIQVR